MSGGSCRLLRLPETLAGLGLLATRVSPRLRRMIAGPRVGKVDMGGLRPARSDQHDVWLGPRRSGGSLLYRGVPCPTPRGHTRARARDFREYLHTQVRRRAHLAQRRAAYDKSTPPVTITADLTDAPQISSDTFDCVIITQTLQMIYDLPTLMRTLHRILKPGGVVLATGSGDFASRRPRVRP